MVGFISQLRGKMAKISVIMPVYNTAEGFLREAIESILSQTFADFEFIIINDGSTTNAKDIIHSYKDKRINYIENQKNVGLIKTLNKGLSLAKGEFIARMDSDDISLPKRFEKQVEFFDKNPAISVLGTWFKYIPSGRIIKPLTDSKAIKECFLVNSNAIGHPTVMFRKSMVNEFSIRYNEDALYVEDYELWLSLIDKVNFANIDEILLEYRIHKDSICQTNVISQSLNCQKIMFEAQGKYFNIDNQKAVNVIKKLKNNEKINSSELLAINKFANQIKKEIRKQGFRQAYEINKDFYKFAIKRCKKDLLFYKLLWDKNLDKILKLRLGFKIINSIRFLYLGDKKLNNKNQIITPKVSVVMALYNTPYKYLKPTIESILNQTFSDFELIIIDDASSKEYKTFLEKFKDNRIKYFKLEKNSGPGHARNEGIKKAKGEYIAVADSDDVYMPERFETQLTFFKNNPEIALTGCAFKFSNRKKLAFVPISHNEIKTFMLFNSPLNNSTIMFRRKKFLEKNLFYAEDINFAEDYELWVDSMLAGIKMANLQDLLMIYTRRSGQLSKTKLGKQIDILKNIYKKIFSHLELEASQEELTLHYDIHMGNFKRVKNPQEISNWFDKIIEHNKKSNIFDEPSLIAKKEVTLNLYQKVKNRLLKIKIGRCNFCLDKNLKVYWEERD